MTTQQGELLIRQRNPQTQRPEWARAYVVLAVDERQLFCFTDDKLDAPRFVLQLRGASVGTTGIDQGAHILLVYGSLACYAALNNGSRPREGTSPPYPLTVCAPTPARKPQGMRKAHAAVNAGVCLSGTLDYCLAAADAAAVAFGGAGSL